MPDLQLIEAIALVILADEYTACLLIVDLLARIEVTHRRLAALLLLPGGLSVLLRGHHMHQGAGTHYQCEPNEPNAAKVFHRKKPLAATPPTVANTIEQATFIANSIQSR